MQARAATGEALLAPPGPLVDRRERIHVALRISLQELRARLGKAGSEVDQGVQRRRRRDYHPLGDHAQPVRLDPDASVLLGDAPYRRAEDHAATELPREAVGQLLDAAQDEIAQEDEVEGLARAVPAVAEPREIAERVKQRDLVGVRDPTEEDEEVDPPATEVRERVLLLPGLNRHP